MAAPLENILESLRDLPKQTLGAIALLVVLAIGVIYGLNTWQANRTEAALKAKNEANQELANTLARRVSATLEPHRQTLKALAQKPSVVAAMSTTKAQREQVAAAERSNIPNALMLRLLPQGSDHIDPNSTPPLTFASVDLLHKAAKTEKDIDAELHLGNTDNEHIVMVQRVPASGEAQGFLHLSLASGFVNRKLEDGDAVEGYYELRQPLSKGPPIIIARGGALPKSDSPAAIAKIAGAAWVISYRSDLSGSANSITLPWSTIGLGLAVVGLVVMLATYFRRRGGAARGAKGVDYQGAIRAILDGAHPGLEQLLPGAKVTSGTSNIEALSQGLEGDDITQFKSSQSAIDEDPTVPGEHVDPGTDAGPLGGGIEVVETSGDETAPIDPSIFRSYDIRGIVGETLTAEAVYEIGRALGSEAHARGQQTVVTARDGRNSSQEIRDALIEGLRDSGRDVLDIGLTPTPVLYFATHYLDTNSGVMITGSHNPPEYNGLKIMLDGESLSGEAIQAIRTRIENDDFTSGEGTMESTEIIPDYIRRISEEIPVSLGDALKVVVDCANSVPGIAAPHILRAIGHDVVELYCEVDGNFPNHHPDPSQVENLADLIETVREEDADLGLAFDGDGDRLGVVDAEGNVIWPDRQMMLFARDVLSRNPGAKIIYDVKCTRLLGEDITDHGGEGLMVPTGHSLIKNKMLESGALLAGEMSGHIFFKERWYGFDDALYSAARLLEILVNAGASPTEVFASLPNGVATPELQLNMPEEEHATFMDQVLATADFGDASVTTIDGLRVDFVDSWGLIRPSNTTPCLVLRFEGDNDDALANVQQLFKDLLLKIDASLDLPF